MTTPSEQRNPYKGAPLRAWIRLQLVDRHGMSRELEMMADTGSPCAIIVSLSIMQQFKLRRAKDLFSNFGDLQGGWLRVVIPEVGLNQRVIGYASDTAVEAAERSDLEFAGLVGLPLLRLLEYGGNAEEFWIRPAS
jgi:hypothetical protein